MAIDTTNLTIKQKAELVKQLIIEIVETTQTPEFINKSENNDRISGIFNTFKEEFIESADCVGTFIADADE